MDFTRQGNMTVNSMFPTCFNPGNLLLSFQTNFYRIISWKLAIFHSARWQKAEDEVKVQGVHIQVCWTPVKAGMQALKQTWDEASINTFKYVGRL